MSDSHLGLISSISKEKWAVIKAKIKEGWENDPVDSERRKAISTLHGRPIVIVDSNKKVIEEFASQLKAAEYLGVGRRIVNTRLASGKPLDSKWGPVYIQDKEGTHQKTRAIQVQVLDANKYLVEVCASLRDAEKKYNVAATTISRSYLNKDKICRNKYYFVSVLQNS